jgi:GNAT superfamily N-acetyltransferase
MHHSWVTRPPSQDDFEAIRQLIETCLITDYGVPEFEADRLEKMWATDGFDLSTDAWVVIGADEALLGYGDVMHATAEEIFVKVYVVSGQSTDGVLSHLLGLAEKRALEHPEKPAMMKCRVSDVNQHLMGALDQDGFMRYLSFLMMEVVLDGPPETPRWADGITVRNFVPDQDDDATYEVDEGASADKGYYSPLTFEDWKKRMNVGGKGFDPTLWWLACRGDEIVGVALNYVQSDGEAAWIDHLGVGRNWRKKGIGKALMLQSFGEFYWRGVKTIKLNVDSESLTNAHRLYAGLGMETVQQYHWYEKGVGVG